jgi:hypothetical protein
MGVHNPVSGQPHIDWRHFLTGHGFRAPPSIIASRYADRAKHDRVATARSEARRNAVRDFPSHR